MINNPIVYDTTQIKVIKNKHNSKTFNANSWGDKDIKSIKSSIKKYYINEQNNICSYCKQKIKSNHGSVWDIEHIIPRSFEKNFMFSPQNLCVTCKECNEIKSNKKITTSKAKINLPTASKLYMIIHPHFDVYEDYLMVIKEGFFYVALEKKGEKTISTCGLNRFYKFAGFEIDDDRILLLSQALITENDDFKKKKLRKEISFLAISGNM